MAAPTPLGVHQISSGETYALVEDLNRVGITADAAIAFVKARAEYLTDKAVADAGALSRQALNEARALSQRALNELPGHVAAEVDRVIGDTREDAAEALTVANQAYEYNQALVAPAASIINAVVTDPATPAGALVAGKATAADLEAQAAREGVLVPASIDHAGVQAALDAAQGTTRRVVAAGEYTTDQTLTISDSCDLSGLTITYTGNGAAWRATPATGGEDKLRNCDLRLPSVRAANKTAKGWSQVAGSVGGELRNLYRCNIVMPLRVTNFDTGVRLLGDATGFVYNTITWGFLENNKVNLHLHTTNAGWVNENVNIGGQCVHHSNEAEGGSGASMTGPAPGTRHILLTAQSTTFVGPNSNKFYGMSLESTGATEFQVDHDNAYNNLWDHCRWETWFAGSSSHAQAYPRVRLGATGGEPVIRGGYAAGGIRFVDTTGLTRGVTVETPTSVLRRFADTAHKVGGWVVENVSSVSSPILTVMQLGWESKGDDPATNYHLRIGQDGIRIKQPTDAADRFRVDARGRIWVGAGGTSEATLALSPSTAGMVFNQTLYPNAAGLDLGGPGVRRWRDAHLERYVRLGGLILRDNAGALEVSSDNGTSWKKVTLT